MVLVHAPALSVLPVRSALPPALAKRKTSEEQVVLLQAVLSATEAEVAAAKCELQRHVSERGQAPGGTTVL